MKLISSELLQIVLAQIQNAEFAQNGEGLVLDGPDPAPAQVELLEAAAAQEGAGVEAGQVAAVQTQLCSVHRDGGGNTTKKIKIGLKRGLHTTDVAYLLHTQQPCVRFPVFPNFLLRKNY